MKLIKVINAYFAVCQLMDREYDGKLSYALYKTKSRLASDYSFFSGKEHELANKYGKVDENNVVIIENGVVAFENENAKKAFDNDKKALFMLDVDYEYKPITSQLPDKIEGVFIEALEGFIDFGGIDDNA